MEFITAVILILGILTVVLSCVTAMFFGAYAGGRSSAQRLSRAISWQLIGEGIIGLGTVSFAYAAHTGALDNWSLVLQSWIRFIMFFATSTTTLHLLWVLVRLRGTKN
jgi:hypothetical protein